MIDLQKKVVFIKDQHAQQSRSIIPSLIDGFHNTYVSTPIQSKHVLTEVYTHTAPHQHMPPDFDTDITYNRMQYTELDKAFSNYDFLLHACIHEHAIIKVLWSS